MFENSQHFKFFLWKRNKFVIHFHSGPLSNMHTRGHSWRDSILFSRQIYGNLFCLWWNAAAMMPVTNRMYVGAFYDNALGTEQLLPQKLPDDLWWCFVLHLLLCPRFPTMTTTPTIISHVSNSTGPRWAPQWHAKFSQTNMWAEASLWTDRRRRW